MINVFKIELFPSKNIILVIFIITYYFCKDINSNKSFMLNDNK